MPNDNAARSTSKPDRSPEHTAGRYVERLQGHRSPADAAKRQRYLKSRAGDGDVVIGVRMKHVFELSKEFKEMPLGEIELLLEGIFRHYGFDFRSYAYASIRRRLWKRIEEEKLSSVSALQERVLHEPEMMEKLLLDLSINVTAMFRDPNFYQTFREHVVPYASILPSGPPGGSSPRSRGWPPNPRSSHGTRPPARAAAGGSPPAAKGPRGRGARWPGSPGARCT